MLKAEVGQVYGGPAPGSFGFWVDFDVYWPRDCGWDGYKDVAAAMAPWCRELWGPDVIDCMKLDEAEGRKDPPRFREARWMLGGKRLYVRTLEQAIEARLRWHGAVK